ncbi:unnamed protein product [Rotaria sp. Silwood1]|nr:unnamed protein product [Rotaria sp. Silwood1]
MTQENRNALVANNDDDNDADDFFGDRSPEYKQIEEEKQQAIDHCAAQHDKLKEKKQILTQEKQQLEQQSDNILDESAKLFGQLEQQAEQMKKLEEEKADLYLRQLNKNKTIALEEANIEDHRAKIPELERELDGYTKVFGELNAEQQELQKQLLEIRDKETENANTQNYLQLSQRELKKQIELIAKELSENEELLSIEIAQREEYERKIQELRREIERYEEEIKAIDKEIEQLNEQQRILEREKKNLEKQIQQLNATIVKLQDILKDKLEKVTRLEEEIRKNEEKIKELSKELEELHEQMRVTNEKLEKMKQDVVNAETQLTQFEEKRKELENERRRLEKELQNLEDERVKQMNSLNRLQQKLLNVEELFYRADTNVKQLEQQKQQQSVEVERLEGERDRLDEEVNQRTEECNDLRERKEAAVQDRQTAEAEHKEAERELTQLKKLEREHSNQYDKAVNEEQRLQAQLNRAKFEEKQAEQQVSAAEARIKSLECFETFVSGIAAIPIPFISGMAQKRLQTLSRAREDLNRAREKHENKKSKTSELRDRHSAVKHNVAECKKQHSNTKKELADQKVVALQKSVIFSQCKTNAAQLIEQHRNAAKRQKQSETDLRMTLRMSDTDEYGWDKFKPNKNNSITNTTTDTGIAMRSVGSNTKQSSDSIEAVILDAITLNIRLKYSYPHLQAFVDELTQPNEHLRCGENSECVSVLHQYALISTREPIDMSNQSVRIIYRPNLFVRKNDAFGPWNFNFLLNLLELDYQCNDSNRNEFPKVWKTSPTTKVHIHREEMQKKDESTNTANNDDNITLDDLLKKICRQNNCDEGDAVLWKRALKGINLFFFEKNFRLVRTELLSKAFSF